MRHEVLTTLDEMRTLKEEWNATLVRSRASSIFLTWEWLFTWASIRHPEIEIFVIIVRGVGGELLGVAPFYRLTYKLLNALPYRALRVIGDRESGGEYQSWFADRSYEESVNAEVVFALNELRREWDFIWFHKQSSWTGFPATVSEALTSGGFDVRERQCVFSTVNLPANFEEYMQNMPAKRRQQTRRMSRKIVGSPGVEIQRVSDPEAVAPALEVLFDLHRKRWQSAGESGAFLRRPLMQTFYERFAPLALQHGWLSMYQLLDNGVPKAVQFGYEFDGCFLQVQEGFDPDYQAHAGNALRTHVIEDCIRRGVHEYDFLGGVTEHKRRWLGEQRNGLDIMAINGNWKCFPLRHANIWPTGAYLKPCEAG